MSRAPESSPAPWTRLLFYTKPDCPLCDKAWPVAGRIAGQYGLELVRVDISLDPELTARHGEKIPVLELDEASLELEGTSLGWGRLSERGIQARLQARGIERV